MTTIRRHLPQHQSATEQQAASDERPTTGRIRAALREVDRVPWWGIPVAAAAACALLRVTGPWTGWEPGWWAASLTTFVVVARQASGGRRVMDAARFREAPRWKTFAESDSVLGDVPAEHRHQAMRRAYERVSEFSELHNFDWVSLGIPRPSVLGYGQAAVVQYGRERHISIGLAWLGRDLEHLPTVLEHELAHLRRRHGPRRRLRRAVGAALLVAAAWFLAPLQAAALAVALAVLGSAVSWAEELACDREARRHSTTGAQAALWREQIVRDRELPRLRRWWACLATARSHPPAVLRMLLGGRAARMG